MMTVRGDGLGAITRDLFEFENAFDFQRHHLADDVAGIAARSILTQMDRECDPDGVPWEPLSPEYAAWKKTVAPGAEIGRLYGLMKDPVELTGELLVNPRQVIQWYGVTAPAKAEALKFTEGGAITGTEQPGRPFYAFNGDTIAELNGFFAEVFVQMFNWEK